jgi:hypothetical protein
MKTKRITLAKLLSFKKWIILFGICLFVFATYSGTPGAGWLYPCENQFAHCDLSQQDIVFASNHIVRGWIDSVCEENFAIEMGAKLGLHKEYAKSEDIPIILFIFMLGWGIAILFVLGVILYQIIIEPLIKKGRLRRKQIR